ncbi:MAG: uroporphyrinogen-III C-methyltransferase, partial [Woeseia sp.]
ELARTGQSLEQARAASTQSSSEVDGMRRTLDERLRSLEAIPGRLSNLESSLSALQGISSGLRDTWLLSEAEYYLQIANAQLQLAGNAELAIIALALADERLASLGNPALTDVRRKVADERRDLESLRDIDLEGAVLTLGSLADAIQTLPLKNDIKVPVADEQIPTTEQSGMARALASLKSAMSDVISVRRSDEPVTPLLPPDAAYFLRNNLALQMQTARLAMLRGEQTIFEESLADALAWINEYYDTESRAVQSATETISELRDMRLTVSKPDISGSLTALRQYMSLRSEMNRAQPESDQ